MKALILAAGMGTRLKPITEEKPKTMVEINGQPILLKQIENLVELGLKDIAVVVGYKKDVIEKSLNDKYPFVKIIENEDYFKTNNMYSLYLAKDYLINENFFLMNGDVYFDKEILEELILTKYIDSIVVEIGSYNIESMKVTIEGNKIYSISKDISQDKSYGVSIDIYKFSKETSSKLFDIIKQYIEVKKDLNQWTEVALNDLLKISKFTACPLKGRWMEIDTLEDLKKAQRIFR